MPICGHEAVEQLRDEGGVTQSPSFCYAGKGGKSAECADLTAADQTLRPPYRLTIEKVGAHASIGTIIVSGEYAKAIEARYRQTVKMDGVAGFRNGSPGVAPSGGPPCRRAFGEDGQ